MSEETADSSDSKRESVTATESESTEESVTVANIQRLGSGYFEHMQSLREQIPVDDYMVTPQTNRWALILMGIFSLVLLVLFPLTMFYQYTYILIWIWLAAFVVFGKIAYDWLMIPNEDANTWRG